MRKEMLEHVHMYHRQSDILHPILGSRDQLRHSIAHHNLQQRHLIPIRSLRIQVFQRSSEYLKLIWNILYMKRELKTIIELKSLVCRAY